MTSKLNEAFFQETAQKMLKNKSVFGAVLCFEKGGSSISWAFLKAFFSDFFFPAEVIGELKENWNMIYFPGQFYFGLGLEKLWIHNFWPPAELLNFKSPLVIRGCLD